MMGYTNPPIIEAVCEFRFTHDTEWDATVPGLIYSAVQDRFPRKEQRITQEIAVSPQSPTEGDVKVQTSERTVFLTKDKNKQIQIAPRLLAINRLKPYTKWEDFKADIEYAYDILTSNVDLKGLQRVGLRYINLIEIPSSGTEKIDLEDYFEFRPELGLELSKTPMIDFIVGCLQQYAEERDLCRTQLRTSGGTSFILDMDYFLAKPETIALDQALKWVDEAHTNIVTVFENCITDTLRDVLGR
jgi:uncharacterized protein (TIGR04255 family)